MKSAGKFRGLRPDMVRFADAVMNVDRKVSIWGVLCPVAKACNRLS